MTLYRSHCVVSRYDEILTSFPAWFKNGRFRVTVGVSARTPIGPALERVLRESLFAAPRLQFWENRVYPRSSSQ